MSQGRILLKSVTAMNVQRPLRRKVPLAAQSPPLLRIQKLSCPSQPHPALSVELGGPSHIPISSQNDSVNEFVNIATDPSPTGNPQINFNYTCQPQTTDVVHISRKKNECSFLLKIGDRRQQALWDSGAARCVLSHNFYQSIPSKFKTELFPSQSR